MPTTSNHPHRGDRMEGAVLLAILLTVAAFAGAASFTHVKDWTLTNSPPGTGEWFGWANAVISELVPIAALLTIRRRRRAIAPVGYPMFLLTAAATLSLAAQLAVAKPGPTGWLLSAVPALAFMALAKLVLTPITTTADTTAASEQAEPETFTPAPIPAPVVDRPSGGSQPEQLPASPREVPERLLPTARFVVVNHEQHTGRPITVDELADRLNTTPAIAGHLLATIKPPATPPPPVPARINGTAVLDGAG
jgi:hypothetical protein